MNVCGRKDRTEKKGEPMNVFETVKGSVTAREAAERYGIKVNHNGFARCPFHDDRIPSMKLGKRYYCFGCQAKGDVIDLTSKLFGLSAKDAAIKLAHDFNIPYDDGRNGTTTLSSKSLPATSIPASTPTSTSASAHEGESDDRRFLDAVWKCATVYIDYLSLLKKWRLEYAPADGADEWHPLFMETLHEKAHVEYLLDVLMNGSRIEVADLIIDEKDKIDGLEMRISQYRREGVIQSEL